jgi:hypothetical protein
VWNHATDSLVEDAGRSTEMERTTSRRVEAGDFSEVRMVLDCRVKKKLSALGLSGDSDRYDPCRDTLR